jgi:hypothetical protein
MVVAAGFTHAKFNAVSSSPTYHTFVLSVCRPQVYMFKPAEAEAKQKAVQAQAQAAAKAQQSARGGRKAKTPATAA